MSKNKGTTYRHLHNCFRSKGSIDIIYDLPSGVISIYIYIHISISPDLSTFWLPQTKNTPYFTNPEFTGISLTKPPFGDFGRVWGHYNLARRYESHSPHLHQQMSASSFGWPGVSTCCTPSWNHVVRCSLLHAYSQELQYAYCILKFTVYPYAHHTAKYQWEITYMCINMCK